MVIALNVNVVSIVLNNIVYNKMKIFYIVNQNTQTCAKLSG